MILKTLTQIPNSLWYQSVMCKTTEHSYQNDFENPYSNVTYRGCFQITSVPNEGRSGKSVDQCHTQVLICTSPGWFIGCLRHVIQSFEDNWNGKNIELYQSILRPHVIIFQEHFVFIKFENDLCKCGDICTGIVIFTIESQAFVIILILNSFGTSTIIIIIDVIIIQIQI